jgi:hypothetical protein
MRLTVHVYVLPARPQTARRRALAALAGLAAPQASEARTLFDRAAAYTHPDVPAGTAALLAGELIRACPGISFIAWEDSGEHGLGTMRAYTRKLGLFTGLCDGDGTVLAAGDAVQAEVTDTLAARRRGRRVPVDQADMDAVRRALDRLYGGPWLADRDKIAGRGTRRQA